MARALVITDYAYVWFEGCFCPITDPQGTRVEVHAGVPTNAIGVNTGLPAPSEALTIDDLFKQVLDVGAQDPDESSITFDPDHHFVKHFSGDLDDSASDDSLNLEIRCFSTDVDAGCPVQTLTVEECASQSGTPTDIVATGTFGAHTCGAQWPGAIGRIAGAEQVCCSRRH